MEKQRLGLKGIDLQYQISNQSLQPIQSNSDINTLINNDDTSDNLDSPHPQSSNSSNSTNLRNSSSSSFLRDLMIREDIDPSSNPFLDGFPFPEISPSENFGDSEKPKKEILCENLDLVKVSKGVNYGTNFINDNENSVDFQISPIVSISPSDKNFSSILINSSNQNPPSNLNTSFNQNISKVPIILLSSNKPSSFLYSGNNNIANVKNKLSAISVPKHLVPERFQIKRTIKRIQVKNFLDGEDEDNLSFQNEDVQMGNEATLFVRRNGELVYLDLSPS
jgi:hypothetical protein